MIARPEDAPREQRKCDDHGEYTSINYHGHIWSKCPECSRIDREQKELEEAEKAKRDKVARWNSRVKGAAIPERFMDRALDSYRPKSQEQEKALAMCKEYADNIGDALKTGRSLIFAGKPGTGKTHLAVGIAIEAMKKEAITVIFSTVMRSVRRIKGTWSRDADETESQAISVYTEPNLLILDEVGVQFGSETEENLIFDIINERYETRKPTIIISNLDIDGIRGYLGDRAFDRLREDGGKYIPFTWDSYRGNNQT